MCSLDQKSLPMESEDHSIDPRIRGIAENRNVLLEALDVNQILLTELLGDEVLDECTKQRITSEKKYGINERFIDWLERSSSQTIDVVLQKLRQDKQHHVANLIDGTEGERPLSAKVKQRIRKLSGWLTINMTTDHGLIDQLFSLEAISRRDYEDIKAKPTESARAMELIDVILRRSDRTMKIFQEALTDSNQHHIAQVVEKDEMIELLLCPTCKTADPNLFSSPKTDKDEELRHKLKTISNHNFALAVVKANNDVIIYVLCDDIDDRRMLEEMFESSTHRAIVVEELIKLTTSDTRTRSILESEVLQLLQNISPNVGHSAIVLQTGANCGQKRELDSISEPRLKKSCLKMDDNKKEEQKLISFKQDQVVKSEKLVFEEEKRSHCENEDLKNDKVDLGGRVNMFKTEVIKDKRAKKKSDDIKMKRFDDKMCKEKHEAEHKIPENQVQVDLTVDDGDSKESIDPVIKELQLKLKLVEKEMIRKDKEIDRLRERVRQVEEEKNEINEDLDEILKLATGEKDRMIIESKRRVRQVEKEKYKVSNQLKKAILAQQQTEKEHADLKERHSARSLDLQNASLLEITNEIKTETIEEWSGLMGTFAMVAAVTLNSLCTLSMCLLILRNTKSRKETILTIIKNGLWSLPLLLQVPVEIPDSISSFSFTSINLFVRWDGFLINIFFILITLLGLGILVFWYLPFGGFGPGVGVGRYCHEDKCVYFFYWNYLSNNMRIGNEAVEQINYNEAGGLFKSQAAFAVWNKHTSDRWDDEIREYTRAGSFIRRVHTKPPFGSSSFHWLNILRLSTGLVSTGHGSLFYDDPMLRLFLLDANGKIIRSFGGPGKGVPTLLDMDREGCVIVADEMSGRRLAICSDEDHMKQLQSKVQDLNTLFEI